MLVVIGGVMSSQVLSSRTQALRLSCQNNLQLTYAGLANYASMNGNRCPRRKKAAPWLLLACLVRRCASRGICQTSGR